MDSNRASRQQRLGYLAIVCLVATSVACSDSSGTSGPASDADPDLTNDAAGDATGDADASGDTVDAGPIADAAGDPDADLADPGVSCDPNLWASAWEPLADNPVVVPEQAWEGLDIFPTSVWQVDDRYFATYVGVAFEVCETPDIARTLAIGRVGQLTSFDGREWARLTTEPIFDLYTFAPCTEGVGLQSGLVLGPADSVSDEWELWYATEQGLYVTTSDVAGSFEPAAAAALEPGAPGSFDDVRVAHPQPFRLPGGGWQMVYAGFGPGELATPTLARAELVGSEWARDGAEPFLGADWEEPGGGGGGPVTPGDDAGGSGGEEPEGDAFYAATDPSVLVVEDCALLAFSGRRTPRVFESPAAIYLATSTDGIDWRVADTPVLAPRTVGEDELDPAHLTAPVLYRDETNLLLLYRGSAEWDVENSDVELAIGVARRPLTDDLLGTE